MEEDGLVLSVSFISWTSLAISWLCAGKTSLHFVFTQPSIFINFLIWLYIPLRSIKWNQVDGPPMWSKIRKRIEFLAECPFLSWLAISSRYRPLSWKTQWINTGSFALLIASRLLIQSRIHGMGSDMQRKAGKMFRLNNRRSICWSTRCTCSMPMSGVQWDLVQFVLLHGSCGLLGSS